VFPSFCSSDLSAPGVADGVSNLILQCEIFDYENEDIRSFFPWSL
jgi:hypothetical protein